jgi:hypothetical protein
VSEQPAGSAAERPVDTAGIAPIFVVGAVRSGTTLLRLMLNEHPDIAIPSESHFIGPLLRTFGIHATLSDDTLERALQIVLDCPEWQRDFGHTPAELRAAVGSQPLSMAEFLDRVFRLEVGSATAKWGDKTPANMRWVGSLLECFPNAQVVAIVRDPRDVYLSLISVKWLGDDPWTIGRYLAHSGGMLREWIASCAPGRLHVLRYEDLVADSEATLRRLCAGLGLAFVPEMVGFHVNTRSNVHQWELDEIHGKLLRAPESDDIARWRRSGSRLDRFEIEAMTADVMRFWCYEHSVAPGWAPLLRAEARARHHLRHPVEFVTRHTAQLQRRVRARRRRPGAGSRSTPPSA